MRPFRIPLIGALSVLVAAATTWAQLSTAQLSGRVADESGAVLPGVTVTVTQTDTGLARTVVTDENGTYVLPNLPTGPYRLEASLQGFRTYAQTGIVLQVAATPVINVTLADRQPRGDRLSRGRGAARRRPERRYQRRRGQRADPRAAAAGAPSHGPDRAGRRGGPIGRAQRSNLPGRCFDLGCRRPADRGRISARRRVAQQSAEQREPADAVPRRAAGVSSRDERPDGPERDARGGIGERDHEVGHQRISRRRLRVPPPPRLQRHQPVCHHWT